MTYYQCWALFSFGSQYKPQVKHNNGQNETGQKPRKCLPTRNKYKIKISFLDKKVQILKYPHLNLSKHGKTKHIILITPPKWYDPLGGPSFSSCQELMPNPFFSKNILVGQRANTLTCLKELLLFLRREKIVFKIYFTHTPYVQL